MEQTILTSNLVNQNSFNTSRWYSEKSIPFYIEENPSQEGYGTPYGGAEIKITCHWVNEQEPELLPPELEYSLDEMITWERISFQAGLIVGWYAFLNHKRLYIRAVDENLTFNYPDENHSCYLTINRANDYDDGTRFDVGGNILSLLSKNMEPRNIPDHCFEALFENAEGLVNADKLYIPSVSLGSYSFRRMFEGSSVVIGANLPQDIITNGAGYFEAMYRNCASLQNIPSTEIRISEVPDYGFRYMFQNCTSLTRAVDIKANQIWYYGCYQMYAGCSSLQNPPIITGNYVSPYGCCAMFSGCSSLTSAPELPATTLRHDAYSNMFENCTSLLSAPSVLPALSLVDFVYYRMFRNCSSLLMPPQIKATNISGQSSCVQMFENCTSLLSGSDLLTKTFDSTTTSAYALMYQNCTSLQYSGHLYGKVLDSNFNGIFGLCSSLSRVYTEATAWGATGADRWLREVSPTGTFKCPHQLDTSIRNISHIPVDWDIELF